MAKGGLVVAGAAVSWVKELASRTVQEKPGGSAEAAQDIPGKHSPRHVYNIFLPGHNSEEGQIYGQEVHYQEAVAVQDDQEHVQGVGVDHQQCVVGEDALLSGARGAQLAQDAGGGGHDGEGARAEGGDAGVP